MNDNPKPKDRVVNSTDKHKLKKGYVHLYFGTGKGKTTAAIGLAIRAAGCGLKVFLGQFIKGMRYSEIKCLERLRENITIKQYGRGCFIRGKPKEEDIEAAQKGLSEIKSILASGKYDLVILDEITIAQYFGLITNDDIIGLIEIKPEHVELVLTGRKASPKIIERADLVTQMKEVKHYYTSGVTARKGIEK